MPHKSPTFLGEVALCPAIVAAFLQTMPTLRLAAMAACIATMAAGYAEGQTWLWTGAGIALLVNVWRYAQARATLERLTSGETPSPAALFAFVNRETLAPGQTQFKRGDTGAEMYLVVDGEIEIVELAKSPWSCPRTGARRQRAPKRKQRARA